ncbi:MAG TPA: HepT-like ribonuclease domain-containing protein [Ruminiclostridium sp.]
MSLNNRNIDIIKHMANYCNEIQETVNRFGKTFEAFESDFVYRNACTMCILQVGELAGKLSEEFKLAYPEIPWKNIKGMRNVFAHNYGNMSLLATWETINDDIPNLKKYCLKIINAFEVLEQQTEEENNDEDDIEI